jgi:lysozyme family protein
MNANWEKSRDLVIESEGGYQLTNIPGDAGGQTYAGIARTKNPDWEGWALIDKGQMPPKEMVWDFYKTKVWDKVRGDELPLGVDYLAFDFAVNSGVGRAVKTLQSAVGANPDGAIGPATMAAIKGCPDLLKRFSAAKEAFYKGIVERKPDQVKFLKGWLNRVAHVEAVADTMLA